MSATHTLAIYGREARAQILSQMLSGTKPMANVEHHVSILVAMTLAVVIGARTAWRRGAA